MSDANLTQLLRAWKGSDAHLENRLVEQIYPEIHAIAQKQLRRFPGLHTLQTTEIVHEAFERMRRQDFAQLSDRAHFYAIAGTVVRRMLVDHLRRKGSVKHGAEVAHVPLEQWIQDEDQRRAQVGSESIDWLELDRALNELNTLDARAARVVELRVFSGLTVEEISSVFECSTATVNRQWRFARAWLASHLTGSLEPDASQR